LRNARVLCTACVAEACALMSVCVDGCILSEWMSDAWAAFEWWNICLWCFLTKLDLTQGSKIFETFNGRLTVHISLSDLTMSIIRKDNSFKLIHLNWFLGWTFVLDSLECGNILAARNSADPKVIFVHAPNNPPFGEKNEPTRRMRWKQFLWCHFGKHVKLNDSTWLEWKWNFWHCKLVPQSTFTPDANKSTRPKRNINTSCEAVVCTPFLQLRELINFCNKLK